MFLAWNEIRRNKLRFFLITGVLMLVAYLVFFLSGLATGLQTLNREAVDSWKADAIVLTDEADKSLFQSIMPADKESKLKADAVAPIGQLSAIANNDDEKQNISLFAIDPSSFIMPDIIEGKAFKNKFEVVASETLKSEDFTIGDKVKLSGSDDELTIVGFIPSARFNVAPVLYTDFDTFYSIKYGEASETNNTKLNGFVVQSDDVHNITKDSELEAIPIENFIEKLPGYSEQNMTLNFMIYFLLIISAVIVAIFLYVLTVQKINIFGVMKAQGISSAYLARSVVAQTFILAFVGVAIGLGLALLTGEFLPDAVPVTFDLPILLTYGAIFVVVAILGSLFSVRTIVKIDPLKAIGG